VGRTRKTDPTRRKRFDQTKGRWLVHHESGWVGRQIRTLQDSHQKSMTAGNDVCQHYRMEQADDCQPSIAACGLAHWFAIGMSDRGEIRWTGTSELVFGCDRLNGKSIMIDRLKRIRANQTFWNLYEVRNAKWRLDSATRFNSSRKVFIRGRRRLAACLQRIRKLTATTRRPCLRQVSW